MSDVIINPELEAYTPEVIASPMGETLAIRFDVHSLLEAKVGQNWQEIACGEIVSKGHLVVRDAAHPTIREADPNSRFGLVTLEGDKLATVVPGIWELYQGAFKQMMQAALPPGLEPLHSYDDPRFGLEPVSCPPADPDSDINYRFESHVDQRYTGVLVLAMPDSVEKGGRLVISNDRDAQTVEEINQDATYIIHRAGTLVCFSKGRFYPHYTEEVSDTASPRVTVSLNYPVEGESPEAAQILLDHTLGKYD